MIKRNQHKTQDLIGVSLNGRFGGLEFVKKQKLFLKSVLNSKNSNQLKSKTDNKPFGQKFLKFSSIKLQAQSIKSILSSTPNKKPLIHFLSPQKSSSCQRKKLGINMFCTKSKERRKHLDYGKEKMNSGVNKLKLSLFKIKKGHSKSVDKTDQKSPPSIKYISVERQDINKNVNTQSLDKNSWEEERLNRECRYKNHNQIKDQNFTKQLNKKVRLKSLKAQYSGIEAKFDLHKQYKFKMSRQQSMGYYIKSQNKKYERKGNDSFYTIKDYSFPRIYKGRTKKKRLKQKFNNSMNSQSLQIEKSKERNGSIILLNKADISEASKVINKRRSRSTFQDEILSSCMIFS